MSLQQDQPTSGEDNNNNSATPTVTTTTDNNITEKTTNNIVTEENENEIDNDSTTSSNSPDISTPTITITDTDTSSKMTIPTIIINHGSDGEYDDDDNENDNKYNSAPTITTTSPPEENNSSSDNSVDLVTSPEETEHPYQPEQLHEQEPLQQDQLHLQDPPVVEEVQKVDVQEQQQQKAKETTVADHHDDIRSVQPSPEPASLQLSPVVDFYRGKTILLTGATGFVGKAVLWKLVQSLGPSLGKIYLLIRNGSNKRSKIGRPADRIKSEILNNKVKETRERKQEWETNKSIGIQEKKREGK